MQKRQWGDRKCTATGAGDEKELFCAVDTSCEDGTHKL